MTATDSARATFLLRADERYQRLAAAAGGFPQSGTEWNELDWLMDLAKGADVDDLHGRLTMYALRGSDEIQSVSRRAWEKYYHYNALFADVMPSVAKMEAEVVSWTASLLGGGSEARGFFTSGGTESIYSGVKSARDHARRHKPRVTRPEMIVPDTAHAAFNKAGEILGVTVVRVRTGDEKRADGATLESAITGNTIMLGASAPNWPYGCYDDIVDIGRLARECDLWFHCDACLGGFLAPFLSELGYAIPPFDLRVPGVCSLSVDLHKYGYAAKPASAVLYPNRELSQYQAFVFDDWAEGLYPTFTFAGSRPAGAIAAAWAVIRFLGQHGYLRLAGSIMDAKRRLMDEISAIDGLFCRKTDTSVLLYGAQDFDIRAVARGLLQRGHYVMGTEERDGSVRLIHLTLDPVTDAWMDAYLSDVREVAALAREGAIPVVGDELRYV